MYAHLIPTWVRKLGPTLLLITCHDLNEPLKTVRYWGSTVMDLDAQALVDVLAKRWEIETFFENDKDLLGSDHYQVMTANAIMRFWTLTAPIRYERWAVIIDTQPAAGRALSPPRPLRQRLTVPYPANAAPRAGGRWAGPRPTGQPAAPPLGSQSC